MLEVMGRHCGYVMFTGLLYSSEGHLVRSGLIRSGLIQSGLVRYDPACYDLV